MFNIIKRAREQAYQQGVAEGRRAQSSEAQARRDEFRRIELEAYIGTPVIIVPNEWDNPVIGFGKSIAAIGSSAILVVQNYLTMQDTWCGGVRMDFSEQRLEIALSLDPYQLWAITAHNAVGHENFDKPKSGQRWGRQRILDALTANGFFQRWEDFKAQQSAQRNNTNSCE